MITLSKEVFARISADGAACYPEECCGIIFGTIAENGDKTALFAEPVENGFDAREKYHRFEIPPEIMLKAASVLIVGMGGLGAPLAQYLAAAGVGRLGLIDFDEVDETNLQRQVIHGTRDIGRPKVASAKDSIKQINPLV